MQLLDYINSFNGKAYTFQESFHGLIGPSFQERGDKSSTLFLNDGTYSLWTSETQAGVHPFLMGRATDKTWFGVYANLIQA